VREWSATPEGLENQRARGTEVQATANVVRSEPVRWSESRSLPRLARIALATKRNLMTRMPRPSWKSAAATVPSEMVTHWWRVSTRSGVVGVVW
jgi:hypothetical protein